MTFAAGYSAGCKIAIDNVIWLGLAVLGLIGGILTTVSGFGGGLLILSILSVVWNPHDALAASALCLFVGNIHRLAMFHIDLSRSLAKDTFIGLFPGAVLGALVTVELPKLFIQVLIVLVILTTTARAALKWNMRIPPKALIPMSLVIGVLAATSGSAAVLVGPMYLSLGLTGSAYIAAVAFSGVVMHVGRVLGYAATGMYSGQLVLFAGFLACAIVGGNFVGKYARTRLGAKQQMAIEHVVLLVSGAISVWGLR